MAYSLVDENGKQYGSSYVFEKPESAERFCNQANQSLGLCKNKENGLTREQVKNFSILLKTLD